MLRWDRSRATTRGVGGGQGVFFFFYLFICVGAVYGVADQQPHTRRGSLEYLVFFHRNDDGNGDIGDDIYGDDYINLMMVMEITRIVIMMVIMATMVLLLMMTVMIMMMIMLKIT